MESFLKGVGVALVTPFDNNGAVDYAALGRVVEHVIAGGVDYLVALGTTAETPTLSAAERNSVFNFVRKQNAGRRPLVVGIGGNCTAAIVESVAQCDLTGVSAILSVTPYYNKPSQRGLYEHYRTIAQASPLPVILYNVPGRTGVNMLPETTLRLASDLPNIVAIKEACGDMAQFAALLAGRPEGFRVISGDDATALALIEMGGDGVISVAANAFPATVAGMASAAFEGGTALAHEKWESLSEMVKALFEEGNPTGVKAALHIKGLIDNVLRLPLVESSPELYAKIAAQIEQCLI